MASTKTIAVLILMSLPLAMHIGCGSPKPEETEPTVEISGPPPTFDEDQHHEQEHQGPHGGRVIELGRSHQYHAEIVEDEQAQSVTVYMLDADLQERSIAQQEIKLSLVVDDKPQSFSLLAMDDGESARFQSTDEVVFDALHEHQAAGKLLVTIDGKSYSGDVQPHDHEGHDH